MAPERLTMSITPKAIQDLLDELEASKQSRLRAKGMIGESLSEMKCLGMVAQ